MSEPSASAPSGEGIDSGAVPTPPHRDHEEGSSEPMPAEHPQAHAGDDSEARAGEEDAVEAAGESPSADSDSPPSDSEEVEGLEAVEEPPVIRRHFTAPALIDLARVDEDATFCLRDPSELEDISALATDLARLGQLLPVDLRLKPPDRFQVVTGFRRVAALRFLQTDRVLARLHTDLSDDDAMLLALAAAIHARPVTPTALEAQRDRLAARGRLTPIARDMIEKALAGEGELAPLEAEEEVDADELAADVTQRLGQCNQDLSLLAEVFSDLDEGRREELKEQLRYAAQLISWLEDDKR